MIEHGGNRRSLAEEAGCPPDEILDFSVNLNPLGMPDGLFAAYSRAFDELAPYPEPYAETLSRLAAGHWRCAPPEILFGNGSSELLNLIPQAWRAPRAVLISPCYLEYEAACRRAGLETAFFELPPDLSLNLNNFSHFMRDGDLVILGNPNNPTGDCRDLYDFIAAHPRQRFVIDEAFADFSGVTLLGRPLLPNAIIVRSMTKFYAMAGLRLGYAAAPAPVIELLKQHLPPWSVGTSARAVAEHIFTMDGRFEEQSRTEVRRLRETLSDGLRQAGLTVFPSEANYLLVRSDDPALRIRLLRNHRIAVRRCDNYRGLDEHYFRVAVRSAADNEKLLRALSGAPYIAHRRKTPALMIQGTCSNAGKSILTAAFCRILLQDGIAVAPFKAQNMALNSFVTADGGEMGRAQAVQAEACRLDPEARMNPILLKPNSDTGSQVIVLGKPIGNMRVREYYAKKAELWETVKKTYDSLSADYQAIVLEGAGSPGEINLKHGDIVNMRMAQYAEAPVLLAGDIDRGGVYASFIGTYATLDPWERELLKGFIVNKFRGDPTLLGSAHDSVYRFTGKPVAGVIDFQKDLALPEEDSVNFSFIRPAPKHDRTLDMVIVQLGHIANFTDFVPFELEPDVTVRKVARAEDFGHPDIVVLPGSKGVADDLRHLRRTGLYDKITGAVRNGAWYLGICGGLQLAGEKLLDPDHIESPHDEVECFGFLPLTTVMGTEKILRRNALHDNLSAGYEIHYGRTECHAADVTEQTDCHNNVIGYERGRVYTNYLHGVFDDDRYRRAWLDRVRASLGYLPLGGVTARYGIEDSLNALADHVRSRLDMKQIYQWMGLK